MLLSHLSWRRRLSQHIRRPLSRQRAMVIIMVTIMVTPKVSLLRQKSTVRSPQTALVQGAQMVGATKLTLPLPTTSIADTDPPSHRPEPNPQLCSIQKRPIHPTMATHTHPQGPTTAIPHPHNTVQDRLMAHGATPTAHHLNTATTPASPLRPLPIPTTLRPSTPSRSRKARPRKRRNAPATSRAQAGPCLCLRRRAPSRAGPTHPPRHRKVLPHANGRYAARARGSQGADGAATPRD